MFRVISRPSFSSLTQVVTSKSQPALAAPETLNFLAAPYSNSSQDDPHDVVSLIDRDSSTLPRLFVVQPRLKPDTVLQAKLDEALNLAYSLEDRRHESCEKVLPHHVVVQNPTRRSGRVRSATFFGPGTVDNIKCHLNAVESKAEVDAVFVNAILSGGQQRNLERIWNKPVLDRVGLIIEIFNAHAQTKEAKLQAELAALMYKKSRLVRIRSSDGGYTFGADGAEVVSARGRGSGGRGFISGAGETELQLQRRRILERRSHLLTEVEEVRRTRAVQRSARKKDGSSHGQGLATVAVVGYTNAGKSTLVSALSNTHLYSDDRLFATVDPRLRSVLLPSGRKALLSDTVGFISELPVQLVEAFHATLEEVVEADLLVHVLDSCAPNFNEQRSTVIKVLEQIGVSKEKLENMIEVWNKIDLLEERKDATEYMDDGEAGSFSGEEDDEASDLSTAAADDDDDDAGVENEEAAFSEVEDDDDLSSQLLVGEPIGDRDDSNVFELSQKTPNDEESKSSMPCMIAKPTESEPHHAPHVKTSAVKKVGLQELLEIIDERLKTEDEKSMPHKLGGRETYNRKWRPPRTEMAAEQ